MALTGYGQEHDGERSCNADVEAPLVEPIHFGKLLSTIDKPQPPRARYRSRKRGECARTTDADWFCMFGTEENGASSRLDGALLARLAALALPLTIDLYPAASTGHGGGDPLERIEVALTALEEQGTTDDAEIVVPFASASGQGTLSLSPQLLRRLASARASLRLELHRFADRA